MQAPISWLVLQSETHIETWPSASLNRMTCWWYQPILMWHHVFPGCFLRTLQLRSGRPVFSRWWCPYHGALCCLGCQRCSTCSDLGRGVVSNILISNFGDIRLCKQNSALTELILAFNNIGKVSGITWEKDSGSETTRVFWLYRKLGQLSERSWKLNHTKQSFPSQTSQKQVKNGMSSFGHCRNQHWQHFVIIDMNHLCQTIHFVPLEEHPAMLSMGPWREPF